MKKIYDAKILAQVEPLFAIMEQRVTEDEMTNIRKAFDLAYEAHSDQKRKTGEPYIIHPIAVARIVVKELMLGANPVIAAFLHDVVEDTSYTIDDIEQMFGKDVAFLVRVVTKQKKEKYDTSKQVDNFKQMLESVQYDIRAILIKLADRLHNMRTLNSMRTDKQMKIAGETDFFYAPLANRLGLYPIKVELENLSFRYRCPLEYDRIVSLLQNNKEKETEHINEFLSAIETKMRENSINVQTEAVYRSPFSTRRKMMRYGCDFNHLESHHFIRVVYKEHEGMSEKDISLKIYALLTDIFKEKPGSLMNYIDSPKENNYQSLHIKLLSKYGKWEEIHISSQRMRRLSTYGCVAEREEGNIAKWIDKFRLNLRDIATHNQDIGFMEGVTSSFYNDNIFVFTPDGKEVILPSGASALDFAFEILGDDGRHAQYARVNGQLCSIKSELHRGDCVEIGTEKTVEPSEDWLACVKTYKGKSYLNSILKNHPKSDFVRCPHCGPLPDDEVIGFKNENGTIDVHKRDCPHAISRASQDGDSVIAIEYKVSETLYPVCVHVKAIDRYHLLSDLINCITDRLHLGIDHLNTNTIDEIVDCDIYFKVHSFPELQKAISGISRIKNVDQVERIQYVKD